MDDSQKWTKNLTGRNSGLNRTESIRSIHSAKKKKNIILFQCRIGNMCLSSYSHKKSCDFKKWHTESKKGDPLTKIVNKISGHINRSTVSIMWEVIVFCLALIILSLPRVLCLYFSDITNRGEDNSC